MNNELNYLYDLKKDDVKDYYFVDYELYKYNHRLGERDTISSWIRESWLGSSDLAYITATNEWDHVKDFRIHSYKDLIEPVNEDGLTEEDCELQEIEFEPVRQKIEHIFDDRYRITRDTLERVKEGDWISRPLKNSVIENNDYLLIQRDRVIENEGDIFKKVDGTLEWCPQKELDKLNIVSSKRLNDPLIAYALINIGTERIQKEISTIMKTFDIHESNTTAVIEHLLDFGVTKVIDDIEDGYLDFNDEKIFQTHEDHFNEKFHLHQKVHYQQQEAA
jgi:hypothetical protein